MEICVSRAVLPTRGPVRTVIRGASATDRCCRQYIFFPQRHAHDVPVFYFSCRVNECCVRKQYVKVIFLSKDAHMNSESVLNNMILDIWGRMGRGRKRFASGLLRSDALWRPVPAPLHGRLRADYASYFYGESVGSGIYVRYRQYLDGSGVIFTGFCDGAIDRAPGRPNFLLSTSVRLANSKKRDVGWGQHKMHNRDNIHGGRKRGRLLWSWFLTYLFLVAFTHRICIDEDPRIARP